MVRLIEVHYSHSRIRALPNRKANLIADEAIKLLKDLPVETITWDNGKEFAEHEKIAEGLRADMYFATPYRSWERGTNENTNGLIRQFFSKNRPLDNVDPDEVQWVEDLLNNRPRKVLGYLTPYEALAKNSIVALHI